MGSIFFQEPSTDGAPGIWSLDDAQRFQAQGKWPTIPATVPDWLVRGPDGTLPTMQADFAQGRGWNNGKPYATLDAFLRSASGTFSRASNGSYFDRRGLIRSAGSNVLRLTHDPLTGEPLGALLEGGATNLLTNSKLAGAVSGTPGTAPTGWTNSRTDGTLDVLDFGDYKHLRMSAANARRSITEAAIPIAANKTYLYSVPANVITPTGLVTLLDVRLLPAEATFQYVLDGQLVANSNFPPSVGKHILGVLVTTAATGGSMSIQMGVGCAGNATGDVIFGTPQLEEGTFRSSAILTPTAAAAQRLADSLSYAISGTPEGTIVIAARTPLGVDGNQTLWCRDDGTTANRLRLVRDSARHLRFVVTVSGTDVVNLDLGTVADDTGLKVAASWKSGLFAASLNGAAAVTDTSYAGALPSVTTMREGSSSNGSEWFGTIKRTARYSIAYSAAQLPGMSA